MFFVILFVRVTPPGIEFAMNEPTSSRQKQQPATVLLTGITGFIAGHIAVKLLQEGYRVRGTLRSRGRADELAALLRDQPGCADGELSFIEADLGDDDGWAAAAQGCDVVIHTASPFPARAPKNADDVVRPAREGTLRVLRAAKAAGVRRAVVTSSAAAVMYGTGQAPWTEADWTEPDGPRTSAYSKSKTVAERAAWDFAREQQLQLAVVNPGLVIGPLLSARHGTSVEVLRKLLTGEFPGLPKLAFPIVDVRDVAAAHVLAMTVPAAAGERFILAADTLSMRQLADALRRACPERADKIPKRQIPDWLLRVAARFDAEMRSVVGDIGNDARVSHEQATRVLGWQPRDVQESIRDTAESLLQFDLV